MSIPTRYSYDALCLSVAAFWCTIVTSTTDSGDDRLTELCVAEEANCAELITRESQRVVACNDGVVVD
jgi:hypothetical protein